jgi:hypothetical protein
VKFNEIVAAAVLFIACRQVCAFPDTKDICCSRRVVSCMDGLVGVNVQSCPYGRGVWSKCSHAYGADVNIVVTGESSFCRLHCPALCLWGMGLNPPPTPPVVTSTLFLCLVMTANGRLAAT